MKSDNYIVIQGWMINDLELSGNKLIAFALIHGFSQDRVNRFNGSLKYIMNALRLSKPAVIKILKDLVELNYLVKESTIINDVRFNKYYVNRVILDNLTGGKETLPNNTNYNTKEINKESSLRNSIASHKGFKRKPVSKLDKLKKRNKDYIPMAKELVSILENHNDMKLSKSESSLVNWANEFRLLHTTNGISIERIDKALQFYSAHIGEQYIPLIESGQTFRRKFASLENQYKRTTIPKRNPNWATPRKEFVPSPQAKRIEIKYKN